MKQEYKAAVFVALCGFLKSEQGKELANELTGLVKALKEKQEKENETL